MPGAYDGLEAARRILAEYRTCVVMLTAYADCFEEAQKIGACGYIAKPLDGQSLLPQFREALHRFQQGGSLS
jgi:AmiR/NasT family two-component response regulator